MKLKLPKQMRPDTWYRACELGVDLPRAFFDSLQQIHPHLYPIWHQYDLLWEQILQNDYEGDEEDPRHTINYNYGHLNFGFVLKMPDGSPKEDCHFHIWEFKPDHGWGHVCKLESTEPDYLNLFLTRLKLQSDWNDKYGRLGSGSYQKYLDQLDEEQREKHMQEKEELMKWIHQENKWLMDKAAENFASGKTAPTNPTKETIYGFSDQGNKTKTIRPLQDEDKESGLILPDWN